MYNTKVKSPLRACTVSLNLAWVLRILEFFAQTDQAVFSSGRSGKLGLKDWCVHAHDPDSLQSEGEVVGKGGGLRSRVKMPQCWKPLVRNLEEY